jgi:hypothetical protein
VHCCSENSSADDFLHDLAFWPDDTEAVKVKADAAHATARGPAVTLLSQLTRRTAFPVDWHRRRRKRQHQEAAIAGDAAGDDDDALAVGGGDNAAPQEFYYPPGRRLGCVLGICELAEDALQLAATLPRGSGGSCLQVLRRSVQVQKTHSSQSCILELGVWLAAGVDDFELDWAAHSIPDFVVTSPDARGAPAARLLKARAAIVFEHSKGSEAKTCDARAPTLQALTAGAVLCAAREARRLECEAAGLAPPEALADSPVVVALLPKDWSAQDFDEAREGEDSDFEDDFAPASDARFCSRCYSFEWAQDHVEVKRSRALLLGEALDLLYGAAVP